MKKYLFILFALVLAASCNDKEFLEENVYKYDSNTFYQTERSMEIGLASCYAEVQYIMWGNMRQPHSWMLMGLGLDSFAQSSATDQFSNWASLTPDSGYARHWDDYLYRLANRANTVVDMIDQHPDISYSTPTRKNELRGEAMFMRAFAYRCVAGMYGHLVYSEHMTTEPKFDYEVISREDAWEKIAEDFKWAEENLPTTPRLTGTVTKAAAGHYLAETYLALGKFAEAEAAATRVINGTDGSYNLMKTRFGNRKNQANDRYGNSLAAPQGAYWDLFRSSATDTEVDAADSNPNDKDNKEAIWVCQFNFTPGVDSWPLGGSGDSWWRTHVAPLEAAWAPWVPMGGKNGTRTSSDGKEKFYIFTADAVCFPQGVTVPNAGTPAKDIPEAQGRGLMYNLSEGLDSLACRAKGLNGATFGLAVLPTEYVTRKSGDVNGSVWDDPNDFRGSEIMIQRDPYTPSGKKWSEVLAGANARAAAHANDLDKDGKPQKSNPYEITAADTMNISPRFWKFSDDRHPFRHKEKLSYNVYDCDWYMIRIAETYLLRAEAYLAQGNKQKAADDINEVRSRAGAKACAAGDVDIDYILDERIRELFGEEHRWITLSRLSCNPKATYVLDKYPVQNATSSNTLYERTRKYGFGYEGNTSVKRETYTDAMGKTRHIPNIKPYNYLLPIPTQTIQSNKDKEVPQNYGY